MDDDTRFPVPPRSPSGPGAARQARHWPAGLLMILALLALTGRAHGQWVGQCIKSFGLPAQRAVYPYAGLIQGTDRAFYGTTLSGASSNLGTVFKLSAAGDSCTVLHSFNGPDGASPYAELVQGTDGALYGTTYSGGATNSGTVFKLGIDGTGFTVLHSFSFSPSGQDGFHPHAGLIQGNDGALYGTTYSGGSNAYGTVFRLSPDGTAYAVLYSFTGQGGDGASPYAGLVQGVDGALYGTTYSGGTSNFGTVFKLATDGTGYTVLYHFTATGGDGRGPWGRLLQGSDGALYGTTRFGGSNSVGTVFRLGTDGSDYAVLCPLTRYAFPTAGLSQGADGALYGVGSGNYSPTGYYGFLFKVNTNGSGYAVLHNFGSVGLLSMDGKNPYGGLVQAADGAFYGTTYNGGVNAFGTVFKLAANGTDVSTFYNFAGNGGDGVSPAPGLLQSAGGPLYGTTTGGGSNNLGTIFRLNTDGTDYTLLYSFTGTNGDGSHPNGLVQGMDGLLYGTTSSGGASSAGTLFSLSTNGSGYSVLFSFSFGAGSPSSRLVQGPDGMLYGTTPGGSLGGGAVFKVGTNGTGYAVLYSFTGTGGDGATPEGALLLGGDGALYGTTYGGSTVFKLNTDGSGYTVLYSPVGGTGYGPYAGLVQGSDGAVYGNTYGGGVDCFECAAADWGTVFKLNTDGSGYLLLHNFSGAGTDAAGPHAELVQGHDGELYGTTSFGGANNNGTVFKLNTNGTDYAVLYSFPPRGAMFGDGPSGGVVQGSDGYFYGTTQGGGAFGYGTVYRLVWAPPPRFSDISRLPDRSIRLTLCGTSNLLWRVQVASNLQAPVAWMPLIALTTTNGSAQFTDPGATNSTCRFYQATWP